MNNEFPDTFRKKKKRNVNTPARLLWTRRKKPATLKPIAKRRDEARDKVVHALAQNFAKRKNEDSKIRRRR